MTVYDDENGYVYTNDSIPINLGWVYRLMGAGDDYVEVTALTNRYVTLKGIGNLILETTILKSYFDNVVKEIA